MRCELENGIINTCGANKSSRRKRPREIGGIGDHVERYDLRGTENKYPYLLIHGA